LLDGGDIEVEEEDGGSEAKSAAQLAYTVAVVEKFFSVIELLTDEMRQHKRCV
jgi:hypothetical protein